MVGPGIDPAKIAQDGTHMTSAAPGIHHVRDFLETLFSGSLPSTSATENVFSAMLAGACSPAQIAAILTALRLRGENASTMSAGATAMREAAGNFPLQDKLRPIADNCGTGGDGSHSFNISTASAIVAAAAGVRVAKHGNRSVSSKCGSADLLFAAGFPDTLSPTQVFQLLEKTGFTFFFAPHFHPGMKHIMPVRQALGVRTIFNLLGPLANPIRPDVQMIGVGSRQYVEPMAEAAKALGMRRALIVHSRDGLDEISPADVTDAAFLDRGKVSSIEISPKAFKISGSIQELKGGDSAENLGILRRLLDGRSHLSGAESVFDAVKLNAGALLWLYGESPGTPANLEVGVQVAEETLTSGRAKKFFQDWLGTAKQLATSSS